MVKIRLKRFGKKRQPSYRIVVMNSRSSRDGRALDEIGFYHPLQKDRNTQIRIDLDKVDSWMGKGAQPTDTVRDLINKEKKK